MPRNASGIYSPPANTAGVPGTLIEAAKYNTLTGDLGNEITASLPSDGRAPMTGSLQLIAGASNNPSIKFTGAPNTGFFYDSVNSKIVVLIAGNEVFSFDANGAAGAGALKPGTIIVIAGATAPVGTVLAYGQAISRTGIGARYFAEVGTLHGAGDGTTTVNVPDMRGCVPVGKDDMGGTDASRLLNALAVSGNRLTIGGLLGAAVHALVSGENGPHTHGITDPGHNHPYAGNDQGNAVDNSQQIIVVGATPGSELTSNATTGITINSSGSGTPHNNTQPSRVFNFAVVL